MTTTLFADAELICFAHDIITIIKDIKNQHQRKDINSICRNRINIPDFHDASKKFFNIRIENLFIK